MDNVETEHVCLFTPLQKAASLIMVSSGRRKAGAGRSRFAHIDSLGVGTRCGARETQIDSITVNLFAAIEKG
jgi:hypothetical protein